MSHVPLFSCVCEEHIDWEDDHQRYGCLPAGVSDKRGGGSERERKGRVQRKKEGWMEWRERGMEEGGKGGRGEGRDERRERTV